MPEIYGQGSGGPSSILIESVTTPVVVPAAGFTTVANVGNYNTTLLCFHFRVTGQNLDSFQISAKAHPDADYVIIGVGGNSYTDPLAPSSNIASGSRIIETSGDLNTVAAGGNGYFGMDITGFVDIKVEVSAAANNASVTCFWSLH